MDERTAEMERINRNQDRCMALIIVGAVLMSVPIASYVVLALLGVVR